MFGCKREPHDADIFGITPAMRQRLEDAREAAREELRRDKEALEKPDAPYRILLKQFPPVGVPGNDDYRPEHSAWLAQGWYVEDYGYADDYSHYVTSPEGVERSIARLTAPDRVKSLHIVWHDLFQGGFPTRRDAERFLDKWLHPDEGTLYDKEGKPV